MIFFIRDEKGASAIEYSLVAGFISILIIVSVTDVGANLLNRFNFIASVFN